MHELDVQVKIKHPHVLLLGGGSTAAIFGTSAWLGVRIEACNMVAGGAHISACAAIAVRRARLTIERAGRAVSRGGIGSAVNLPGRESVASSFRRPGKLGTNESGAAVAAGGAAGARVLAFQTSVGDIDATPHTRWVGDAERLVAAVGRRGTGLACVATAATEAVAARHTEGIELTHGGAAFSCAAIVPCLGEAEPREIASAALRIARWGGAADADLLPRFDDACHTAGTR
jgi:hypothetical protein